VWTDFNRSPSSDSRQENVFGREAKVTTTQDAARLCQFICALPGFDVQPRKGTCYAHMGATICDTILQAGMNYRTVVAPRVRRVLCRWPDAATTSRFVAMIEWHGLNDVLLWRNAEKPTRIGQLAVFLQSRGVETEVDSRDWLASDENSASLQAVRGVGPKTVDYFKSLAGLPAVAVDRHVRTFVAWAGIRTTAYNEIRDLVSVAADTLHVGRHDLDHAIWSYVSTRQRGGQTQCRDDARR
jgi:hypothetical protein